MLILRQSTAIDVRMGPFVDATDGVTPETGITLGAADQAEVLKANGAATAAMAGAFAAVTGADGWYDYTASTTDTNTVGEVVFVVQDSSVCLPVYTRAYVVEEAVYDAFFAGSAAGIPSIPANWITAAGIASNAITSAKIASSAIGATQIATDAITAAKIAANAIGASELAADAVTEIQSGLATSAALATAQTDLDTITGSDGVTLATAQANYAPLVSADLPSNFGSLVISAGGTVNADAVAISGSTTAADNLEESTEAIITGAAQTGTLSTTQATTNLSGYADDELIGREIVFKSGTANGQVSRITDYASTSGLVTFNTIATAPANGDLFVIV